MSATKSMKDTLTTVGLGVAGLIAVIIVFGSYYTVEEGFVVVESTMGKFNDNENQAGLHFKLPILTTAHTEDVKMQTVNYKGGVLTEDTDPKDGVTQRPRITILDSKNLPIGVDLTVQFTPKSDEMSHILRTYGVNYFDKKINPIIRDVARDVASEYEAETVAQKRSEIGSAIKVRLEESLNKLENAPFTLNDVALRNIVLPNVIQAKVVAVQEAKQEEQRLDMVEKQALVTKKIKIIDAERAAQEVIIAAKAKAQAVLDVAKAQAKANNLVSASLSTMLIKQNWVAQWDGVLPKTNLGGDNQGVSLLMSVDK